MYNFYYDESEHSRIINLKTITGETYYDNFLSLVVGWDSSKEDTIKQKYLSFEKKYNDRKKKGELKSSTFKSNQFSNGFASFNKQNAEMLDDFLSIIDDDFLVYFSVESKIEYIILQLFRDYKNNFFVDMDSIKYSITKAILVYWPDKVISAMYSDSTTFISALIEFFNNRIEINKKNLQLKKDENQKFESIISILQGIESPISIEWNYRISFWGFDYFLKSKRIFNYNLAIDKEGEGKTLCAAKKVGIKNCIELESTEHFGLRIADMLVGIIGKLMKSIYTSLKDNSNENVSKILLDKSWFKLDEKQLSLYKKLYHILLEINNDWWKIYSGFYADDLVCLLGLLDYINCFESSAEIYENFDKHPEGCNAYICNMLLEHFEIRKNKIPVRPIVSETKEYFRNNNGAKVYFDIHKQPKLPINVGENKYFVLSVGFDKNYNPLVTVADKPENQCFRLPEQLKEWAMFAVGLAKMGENIFPSDVVFSKIRGHYYADVL